MSSDSAFDRAARFYMIPFPHSRVNYFICILMKKRTKNIKQTLFGNTTKNVITFLINRPCHTKQENMFNLAYSNCQKFKFKIKLVKKWRCAKIGCVVVPYTIRMNFQICKLTNFLWTPRDALKALVVVYWFSIIHF